MTEFQYVAWFRDSTLPPDDQDYEWPVCFVVVAADSHSALSWGDHLAVKYAATCDGCEFLRSYLDSEQWEVGAPKVIAGEEPPPEIIGW